MWRARALLAVAMATPLVIAMGGHRGGRSQTVQGQPGAQVSSGTRTAASLSIDAIRRARVEAGGEWKGGNPQGYVSRLFGALSPSAREIKGWDFGPLPIDRGPVSDQLYANYARILFKLNLGEVFDGDKDAAALHSEVVSFSPQGDTCSGIVIAKNAVATAAHCVTSTLDFVRFGNKTSSNETMTLDPDKWVAAKTYLGKDLDMAVLVSEQAFAGVDQDDLPVFASSAMISQADHLTIIGFGGAEADSARIGTKRLGIVPMGSSDCNGANEATTYGCLPDYEILAGARPLFDRIDCASEAAKKQAQGACQGDSGGPAFVTSGDKLYLAGLIRTYFDPGQCGCAAAVNIYVRMDTQVAALKKLGVDLP